MGRFLEFINRNTIILEADVLGRSYRLTKAIGGSDLKNKYSLIKKAQSDAKILNKKKPHVFHMINPYRNENPPKEVLDYLTSNAEISVSVKTLPWNYSRSIVLVGQTDDLIEYYETDVFTKEGEFGEKYPKGVTRKKGSHDWDEAIVKANSVNWNAFYISQDAYSAKWYDVLSKYENKDGETMDQMFDAYEIVKYNDFDEAHDQHGNLEDIEEIAKKLSDIYWYFDYYHTPFESKELEELIEDMQIPPEDIEFARMFENAVEKQMSSEDGFSTAGDTLKQLNVMLDEIKEISSEFLDSAWETTPSYNDGKLLKDLEKLI